MKLIVNADDFGLSRGTNYGIIDSCRRGVVRSTTLMCNMPAFYHAIHLAEKLPMLGVGLHLVLTTGFSLTKGASFTDSEGHFLSQLEILTRCDNGTLNIDEISKEWDAQIVKALNAGVRPTHLDSHHHVHMKKPLLPVFLEKAKKLGIPVRLNGPEKLPASFQNIPVPAAFTDSFYGENATAEHLQQILVSHSEKESLEMMTHPAYLDADLLSQSSYGTKRTEEAAILTHPKLLELVNQRGIQLANYRDLS